MPGLPIPPPGVTPNFINPPTQATTLVAVNVAGIVVVTLSLGMRLYTKRFLVNRLGIDDYLCTIAWCLAVALCVLNLKGISVGMARHSWDFDFPKDGPLSFEYFQISLYVSILMMGATKLACLFFYRTIFHTSRNTMVFVYAGIVGVCLAYIGLFFAQMFQCIGVGAHYSASTIGTCPAGPIVSYVNGGISILTDIYVLIIPIPAIWSLPLKTGQKLRVISVLGCGLFACTMTITRVAVTPSVNTTNDFIWTISRINMWGSLESNTALMCVCLLVLPAFLKRHWPVSFNGYVLRIVGRSTRNKSTSDEVTGVSTGRRDIESQGWSQMNRSDEVCLTTVSSAGGNESIHETTTEPARYNMTRPLSLSMPEEPSAVHNPLNYDGRLSKESGERRQEKLRVSPMGGLRP